MSVRLVEPVLKVQLRKRVSPRFLLDVNFDTGAGFTVLFGASGSGKTTILDCIAGLQRPDEGLVSVGDAVLFDGARSVDVPARRRQLGYLFQNLALFPHMTARENIEYGLDGLARAERSQRVHEIAESFGIAAVLEERPGKMSGGERQRVALARALVTRPRALLLDEPLTALDTVTKGRIIDDLRRWVGRHPVPVLYVTHDREEVQALGDMIAVVEAGRLVAMGTPHEVLRRPQRESVAHLAGVENVLACEVVARHPEEGTMSCRVKGSALMLEVPLTRLANGPEVRVGIRAGDVLLAASRPEGLSARNVLSGNVAELEHDGVSVVATVDCGTRLTVQLSRGACREMCLAVGNPVWVIVKTYSCHVLAS